MGLARGLRRPHPARHSRRGGERAGLRGGNQQAYVGNTPIMLGGDLIVAIDGQQVTDPQDISVIMDKHQAGDVVSVSILRGHRQMTLKLQLAEARTDNN